MKTKSVGIIAEYNPFHNGHLYHIEESRRLTGADVVVCVMSGNFMQRGQMAIADKWERAEAAVRCGADLVVELPTVFACNSAPYFAKAGVEILENLGTDYISFGSESGNIDELAAITREISANEEMESVIRQKVKDGIAYPRARREAAAQLFGEEKAQILDSPNNILAVEYLKAMKKAKPVTVCRKGPGYHDLKSEDTLASATAIRYLLEEKKDISALLPEASAEIVLRSKKPSQDVIFELLCHKVLTTDAAKLDKIEAGGEGLGNKVKSMIRTVSSYEELVDVLKSKRYTRTRINRFLMQLILEVESVERYNNYVRVLAFNDKGSAYLKQVKKGEECELPIITNINKDLEGYEGIVATVNKDILASDLYNLASGRELYRNSDFVKKPTKISLTP